MQFALRLSDATTGQTWEISGTTTTDPVVRGPAGPVISVLNTISADKIKDAALLAAAVEQFQPSRVLQSALSGV